MLKLLEEKEREGIIAEVGTRDASFADPQILSIAIFSRMDSKAVFITQDENLSEDLLKLKSLSSVRGQNIQVNRVNNYGFLSRYATLAERLYPAVPAKETAA